MAQAATPVCAWRTNQRPRHPPRESPQPRLPTPTSVPTGPRVTIRPGASTWHSAPASAWRTVPRRRSADCGPPGAPDAPAQPRASQPPRGPLQRRGLYLPMAPSTRLGPGRWRHRPGYHPVDAPSAGCSTRRPPATRAAHQLPGPLCLRGRYPPDGAIGRAGTHPMAPSVGLPEAPRDRKPGERRTRMRGRSEPGPQDRLVKVPVPLPLRTSAQCRVIGGARLARPKLSSLAQARPAQAPPARILVPADAAAPSTSCVSTCRYLSGVLTKVLRTRLI